MSNAVAKAYAENLERFLMVTGMTSVAASVERICYCPDMIAGLLLSFLGFKPISFKSQVPDFDKEALFPSGFVYSPKYHLERYAKHTVVMHYVSPREMLAADQRATHEKVDRMLISLIASAKQCTVSMQKRTAGPKRKHIDKAETTPESCDEAELSLKLVGLVDYFRKNIDHHFQVLRNKQIQIKKLAIRASLCEKNEKTNKRKDPPIQVTTTIQFASGLQGHG